MKNTKRQSKPVKAGDRKRVAVRRSALKGAQVAMARQQGERRNAARTLGLNAPARKRKTEPVIHKAVAKQNTSIPGRSRP